MSKDDDFALDLRVVKYLLAAAVTGVKYTSPRDGDASDIEGVLRWAYERAASEESRADAESEARATAPAGLDVERWRKASESLEVIDGIVDDTHPEGDGCPLCHELDNLREVIDAALAASESVSANGADVPQPDGPVVGEPAATDSDALERARALIEAIHAASGELATLYGPIWHRLAASGETEQDR